VSVPVVPEIPASPDALSRRASAVRLGLLTTTLALIVGGFAWFSDAPVPFGSEPIHTMSGMNAMSGSGDASGPANPLAPHVRQGLEQDYRLAALALDIQQSHESLARLWEDARSLAESVGALASGIDNLKLDVGTARIDAAAAVARLEERLHEVKVAVIAEPTELGDPALRGLARLGHPEIADATSHIAEAAEPIRLGDPSLRGLTRLGYPEIADATSQVAETAEPIQLGDPALRNLAHLGGLESAEAGEAADPIQAATTGGLDAAPQATVEVTFNKPKQRARATKPISGWLVHSVRDDLALVASGGAHYEVKAGELLPGAGIVRGIKKRGEQWVVLTSKGIITEAR
jgi:hypothetical protein